MSRPIRIQYPGATYHIMSRGNGGHAIFNNSKDYQSFLNIFSNVLKDYNWISYAYCLMPNHYHLLIKTIDPNLSIGMRQLNGNYTRHFNMKNKRFGHLFQGRYKSILIDMDNYKYQVIRYIALNPTRSKLIKNPNQWPWSSHLEMIDETKKQSKCLHIEHARNLFDHKHEEAKINYLKYLSDKIEDEEMRKKIERGVILGSNDFVNKVKDYFKKESQIKEIPIIERYACRPKIKKLFENITNNKQERNKKIMEAHFDHGYTLSEIGNYLELHYSSISKIISNR